MPRRKTIGRDPLARPAKPPPKAEQPPPPRPEPTLAPAARRPAQGREAIGGQIELLGGDLGRATVRIELFGNEERMGLFAHEHEFVDLESQLASIVAWPDEAEHRILSAIGWGWGFGVIGGTVIAIAGGALRLLRPRRMMFEMRLTDGRNCVGRTDQVTTSALEAIARGQAAVPAS